MLMLKLGAKSSLKNKWEFVAIALVIGLPLALYIIAGSTSRTLNGVFKSYLVNCYGDVIAIGYIPLRVDQVCSNISILKDFTGYLVVPSYAVSSNGKTYPLLLGYTEAAYRNDTLLGGFKVPNLKPGEAVLLRGYSTFIKPGVKLTVYPAITINKEVRFNLTVVGYAEGALPLPAGPVLFLSKEDGKKLLNAFGGYTVYSLVFKKKVNEKEALKIAREIFERAGGYIAFLFYSKKDLLFYPGQDVILSSESVLKFLSISSWIIATIIVIIISLAIIEKNLREIATIRSLGASTRELFSYLLSFWVSRSLIGFTIALILGYLVTEQVITTMLAHPRLRVLKPFIHITLDPSSIMLTLIMSLTTALLATLASLLLLRKIKLMEAMRFYGIKLFLKFESELPPSVLIALSEIKGLPWKGLGAVLILALGSSAVLIPIQIAHDLEALKLPHYYDVELTVLRIPKISLPLEFVLPQVQSMKGIKDLSIWLANLYGSVNFKILLSKDSKSMYVKGFTCIEALKGSCLNNAPPLITGRYPRSAKEIAVSNLLAHVMNIRIGDEVNVRIDTLNRVIREKVKVVGIYDWPIYPPSIIFNKLLLKGVDLERYKTYVIFANVHGNADILAEKLQSVFVTNAYAAASKTWKGFYVHELNNINHLISSLIMAMAISFSVVALSSLMYTFAEIVTRTKIFALLKSIGFDSNYFAKVMSVKWLVIAFLSTLLLPLIAYPLYELAWGVVSKVYLIPKEYLWSAFLLPFTVVPLIVIVAKVIHKGIRVSKELNES